MKVSLYTNKPLPSTNDEVYIVDNSTTPVSSKRTYIQDLLNMGYVVFNVMAYGAKGDGTTDDTTAINNCIQASTEGSVVFFPPGVYRVSTPIYLFRNRTYQGSQSPRWQYDGGSPCVISAMSSFAGTGVVVAMDKEQMVTKFGGSFSDTDGIRMFNLGVTGNNYGSSIPGILLSGWVLDFYASNVDSSNTSGNGWSTQGYASTDTTTHYPRGFYAYGCSSYLAHNIAWSLNNLTDSTLTDCLATQSSAQGFYVSGCGESKLVGCRAVFCQSDGFIVLGAPTVGGLQLVGCSTDRNQHNGVNITATGTQPVTITNLLTRRDGGNGTPGSGGGGYAGLMINGGSSGAGCPVIVDGLAQTVGINDDGTGSYSPQYGVSVTNSSYLHISGFAWGVTNSYYDGGGNTTTSPGSLYGYNGSTSPAVDTSLYSSKLYSIAISSNIPVMPSNASGASGSVGAPADAGHIHPRYEFNAGDINLKGWNFDPVMMSGGAGVTSGTLQVVKIHIPTTTTVTNILLRITTGGSTLTAGDSQVALYNSGGTLLSGSADQSSSWTSSGMKTIALTTPQTNLAAGDYYVAFWSVGTTPPQFGLGLNSLAVNGALTTANSRFATANTGLTNTPPGTLGTFTAAATSYWAGIN